MFLSPERLERCDATECCKAQVSMRKTQEILSWDGRCAHRDEWQLRGTAFFAPNSEMTSLDQELSRCYKQGMPLGNLLDVADVGAVERKKGSELMVPRSTE